MGSFASKCDIERFNALMEDGKGDGNRAATGKDAKRTTDWASFGDGDHNIIYKKLKPKKKKTLAPNEYNEYERFVRDWLSNLRKHDPFADFDRICAMEASKPALKWLAHPKLHRHPDYKAFDSNLAAFSTEDDFWNASVVTLSDNPNHKVILAQLPDLTDTDQMKSFWNTVKANNATSVHILGDSLELAHIANLFALESGTHRHEEEDVRYHGTVEPLVLVKTKRVTSNIFYNRKRSKMIDRFTVDVSVMGEADATTVSVHTYPQWPRHSSTPFPTTPLCGALIINNDLDDGETVLIASAYGAGRPGTLLALAAALRVASQNKIPNFPRIITEIREQRPMAVDSMTLVLALYEGVFCFLNTTASGTLSDEDELVDDFIEWVKDMSRDTGE